MSSGTRRDVLEKGLVEGRWRRMLLDPLVFFSYIKVISKDKEKHPQGWAPLDLWDHQLELLQDIVAGENVILVKARQLGATTLVLAWCLYLMCFSPGGATITFVSKDRDAANEAIDKLAFMWERLPAWLRQRAASEVDLATTHVRLHRPDGSKSQIKSMPATATTGAGGTVDLVVLDEFALAEKAADIFRTVSPTTDAGGQMLILSTARGENFFSWLYREAKGGWDKLKPLFFPWWKSRLFGREDYEQEKEMWRRKGEPHRFYQERPSNDEECFTETADRRFQELPPISECEDLPLHGRLERRDGKVEFLADADHVDVPGPVALASAQVDDDCDYAIGVDTSKGAGGDYQVAQVLKCLPSGDLEIVGYMRTNQFEPTEFVKQLDLLGRFFSGRKGPALVAIEDQGGHGSLPNHVLANDLRYPRVWRDQKVGTKSGRASNTFGFKMHKSRKPQVVDRLAEYLASGRLHNIHSLLREELGKFVRHTTPAGNTTFGAESGHHDDLVMSLAIAVSVAVEADLCVETLPKPLMEQKGFDGRLRLGMVERIEKERRDRRRDRNVRMNPNDDLRLRSAS